MGGFAKLLLDGQLVVPQVVRVQSTNQTILYWGFLGPLLLGPIAAFAVTGLSATAADWQTEFSPRAFWGPFAGSIPAGIAATYVLAQVTKARLDAVEAKLEKLLERGSQADG